MAIITLPAALKTMRIEWGQRRYDLRFENGDSGAGQTRLLAPPRWTAGLVCTEALSQAEAALWRSLVLSLDGRVNQLALYDIGNPAPRGTMRGTLTLSADATQGATTLSITGGVGQASTTLLTGDWIGVGTGLTRQLFSVAADATANASGVISVSVKPAVRVLQTTGTAVAWDSPTALFRQTANDSKWAHEGAVRSGYSLDLIESWE